jgi:A/G-specific adenine glycosylase
VLLSPKTFRERLLRWYTKHQRGLPWRRDAQRPGPVDPYHILVSETMLQQTQVATVIPYYLRFLARFPTVVDLATADEQEVLRLWQGLGYYSRARNLQSAAQRILSDHGGKLPCSRDELLGLPGVGRYTAGAVASIAFDQRAPILDGNITRVLCRLDNIHTDPRSRENQKILWSKAEQVLPSKRVGDFNSALMELGATVCTPRNPQCLLCPVQEHCEAFAAGTQESIPARRKIKPTPLYRRKTYCISRDGKWLIEQRPTRGRWGGMWQFITVESGKSSDESPLPVGVHRPRQIGSVFHALTHRRYEFKVFIARSRNGDSPRADRPTQWVALDQLHQYPLPRPHSKIAEMLRKEANGNIEGN